jgi:hypothetical protein
MNKLIRPAIAATLTVFLALSCAMIAFSTKPPIPNNPNGAALFVETTATPPVKVDRSVAGSTDGIILMGGVIVLIVLIPIILQRKAWTKEDPS